MHLLHIFWSNRQCPNGNVRKNPTELVGKKIGMNLHIVENAAMD